MGFVILASLEALKRIIYRYNYWIIVCNGNNWSIKNPSLICPLLSVICSFLVFKTKALLKLGLCMIPSKIRIYHSTQLFLAIQNMNLFQCRIFHPSLCFQTQVPQKSKFSLISPRTQWPGVRHIVGCVPHREVLYWNKCPLVGQTVHSK